MIIAFVIAFKMVFVKILNLFFFEFFFMFLDYLNVMVLRITLKTKKYIFLIYFYFK